MKKVILIIALALALSSCAEVSYEEKIKAKLEGYELVYYNLKGDPVTYVVHEEDINSIEEINEKGAFYKVNVGKGISWELYLDENYEVIRERPLFVS